MKKNGNNITQWFGENLAKILAKKIEAVYPTFNSKGYCTNIKKLSKDLTYTQRIALHADELHAHLPKDYKQAIHILLAILGEENPNETGMFTHYYWILPIGKFIEKYGLDDFKTSIHALEEITKRNTAEYAVRPFIRKYPQQTMKIMHAWSTSKNFHLRRLASEGCRPKLPWATKLDTFINNPKPVFRILENLMTDDVKFVQKSVANNIADYLKVNKSKAVQFIKKYEKSENKHTQWILKHATRKL